MMQNLKRIWLVCSKLTRGIWRILTRALKNLENFHFNGLLLNKVYNAWAKGKLTCAFINDMGNLSNFNQSTFESLKIGTLIWTKVENVWVWNLPGGIVWWQWRMMEDLKRNWLFSSKLTWGIWQILTWTLKNFKNLPFNRLLLTKVYNVWAKKSIEELCLMALKIDAKFEGKLTCAF